MAGSTDGDRAPDVHRRSRSRSQDHDSDAERRRRRHRRERGEHSNRRPRRTDEDRKERRDRDEMDVERRRSRSPRSPREESSRRRHRDREHERDARHRARRERSARPGSRERDGQAWEEDKMQITRKAKGPLPSQEASFSLMQNPSASAGALVPHDGTAVPEKQRPNFAPTGLLAAATKTVEMANGTTVVLKYHEPAEARKPPARDAWKLFVFKGGEIVDTIELGLRSCWLIGREVAVVDLPAEHPSVSKQHAVIQFRYVEKRNEFGDKIGRVKPYLIDLESANGTMLNGERVEESRYVELRDKDLVQFGDSTREYVVMLPPKD